MNPSDSSYKTLFIMFYEVANFCEGNSGEEDVEVMFRCAKILEDTCRELENTRASENFEAKLNEFWDVKGYKRVPLQYFEKVSHHVLSRYMADSKFSDSEVNMAIHQFITNRSEKEFQELVQQLASTNQTVETLRETLTSAKIMDKYAAEHHLKELTTTLITNRGDVEELSSEIAKSISNDQSMCILFLNILCLPSSCEITLHVQELVALSLSNLLRDSDYVNVYPHFLRLSVEDFNRIVSEWHYFLEAFQQTIRVSVERLRCDYSGDSYTWTNTGTDPCLSFDHIVGLISRCRSLPGMSDKIKEFLQQIGEEGFGLVVEDVMQKCQIR